MLGPILGSIAGSLVTGLFNKKEASSNRDFQEEMSNTAHQREVQDLIAAGINPMLSAKLGGASSPGGSVATMPDLGQTVNSAVVAQRQAAEIDKVKESAITEKTQQALNLALAGKAEAEQRQSMANALSTTFDLERKQWLKDEFNEWWVAGYKLDADKARNVYDKFYAERDFRSVHQLDELARKEGYDTFDAAVENQAFRDSLRTYLLRGLQIPQAEAMSDFWKSEYGREIAPYISGAGSANDLLGTIGAGVGLGRRVLGLDRPIRNTFIQRR